MNNKEADQTAQADMSLCCSHMAFTGFLMTYLIGSCNSVRPLSIVSKIVIQNMFIIIYLMYQNLSHVFK